LAVLAGGLLCSCASVPRFDELRDIQKAPSLQEALLICSHYDVRQYDRRPIGFKPYVECVDHAAEAHPPAPGSAFETFQREIHSGYSHLKEPVWSRALAVELETATDAALRILWEEPGRPERISERDRALLKKHYPRLSRKLGLSDWQLIPPQPISPELESLRAALAALEEQGTASDQACQDLRALRLKIGYLGNLWRDATLLHSTTLGRTVLERYRLRVSEAQKDLQKLRPEVEANPLPAGDDGLAPGCPRKAPNA
jgi:hypothetical protein